MKQKELLKRSLDVLESAYEGEKCDHSVGICYCVVFDLINEIKTALKIRKNKRRTA